jgi:hypothetical protein
MGCVILVNFCDIILHEERKQATSAGNESIVQRPWYNLTLGRYLLPVLCVVFHLSMLPSFPLPSMDMYDA